MKQIASTRDLQPHERAFVDSMRRLQFGRVESLRITRGALVLDPWPTMVQSVKFATGESTDQQPVADEFELKRQVIELFEYVRAVEAGEIHCLEVRHGLPFCMEIQHRPAEDGGNRG